MNDLEELPSLQRTPAGRCVALLLLPVRPLRLWTELTGILLYPVVLVAGFVQVFVPRRHDAFGGTTVRSRGAFRTREVDLAAADAITLHTSIDDVLDDGATLIAKADGEQVRLGLFAYGLMRRRTLPPPALRRLADALEVNQKLDTGKVADLLRTQANHLEDGLPLGSSPLRAFAKAQQNLVCRPGTFGSPAEPPLDELPARMRRDPSDRRLG